MSATDLPLEIDCRSVQALLKQGDDLLLVDCREPDEHAIAHISEATLLPMGEMQNRLGELEPFRARPLVVHCHHGGRSLRVVQWLRSQGFSQAQSLAGGIDAWSQEIDPSIVRY